MTATIYELLSSKSHLQRIRQRRNDEAARLKELGLPATPELERLCELVFIIKHQNDSEEVKNTLNPYRRARLREK